MNAQELAIGFDADDTLWHNENIFEKVHERYRELLAHYHDAKTVDQTLLTTEIRNLEPYGYGVKGFTLSSVETAIELSAGKISAQEILEIIQLGREMLAHPVELLEGVAETIASLSAHHQLIVITKGDLRDQERKLKKSGIAQLFHHVEIVSEKDVETYATLLRRHAIAPGNFLMVGNSLKSDMLPVLELGGAGAHVPYAVTWAAERAEARGNYAGRFFSLRSIRDLPAVIKQLRDS